MRHITIIDGHPHPQPHLNHALADRYMEGARAAGHEVRRIDVARMDFPILRDPNDFYNGEPPEAIRDAQRDIQWADHMTFFYPLWEADMPALLKAFIEQTFRPGFALESAGLRRFPKPLLEGRSARIVTTMGMPALIYRALFGAYSLKSFKRSILQLAGIRPVFVTLLGGVETGCEAKRKRWLDEMAVLAEEDGKYASSPRVGPVAAAFLLLVASAYLAYAGAKSSRENARRSRRGSTHETESLADEVLRAQRLRL
jgi:putative NADPH-quinone reductase